MNRNRNPSMKEASIVYEVSRWDAYQWRQFQGQSPDTRRVLQEGRDKLYSFPAFGKEVFHRLFNSQPRRLDKVKPEHEWACKAHTQLDQVPDFARLAQRCRGDRFMAGIAATAFSESILANLPTPSEHLQDPQPLRQQIHGLKAIQHRALDAGQSLPAEIQDLIDELVAEGKASVGAAQAFAQGLDDAAIRQSIRAACSSAQETVQQVQAQVDAFSFGSQAGTCGNGGSMEDKMALARKVQQSSKLQWIAREAGRMRRLAAQKQRSKADTARSEVSSIEMGAELSRLLPAELVKLAAPALWGLFARGYVERGLLQYKLSGKEPQGRGPIVVCLDSSGSMAGHNEVWSKAVALALLSIAVAQGRTCRVVHFTSAVERIDHFPSGKVDTSHLLAGMEQFFDGGTDYEAPLLSALEAIQSERELKKADVVFITDGECHVSHGFAEMWQQAQQDHEFTCYGILLGMQDSPELRKVASPIIPLTVLSNDSEVTDRLFSI